MRIDLNGASQELPAGATLADAVRETGAEQEARGVAVALDGEVVPRTAWAATPLADGSKVEVLAAIQGGQEPATAPRSGSEPWRLAGREWTSRLIAGTGGFRSLEQMEAALTASGARLRSLPLRPLASGAH